MPKTTVFELKSTLKAGTQVFLKGSVFNEENLPDVLRDEVESGSGTIEVKSYGQDFESSEFTPEQSITVTAPKRRLVGRPKGTVKKK